MSPSAGYAAGYDPRELSFDLSLRDTYRRLPLPCLGLRLCLTCFFFFFFF
jgi:hypothetical protein